jgi:3-hydroxyisobutyrate dehydrogenase-like beta-hydroxyacid dehydrogenase
VRNGVRSCDARWIYRGWPERVRPLLAAYGDPVLQVGPLGAGQGVKLVNNAVFAANIGLLAEAVRLGASFGIEDWLLGALAHCSAARRAQGDRRPQAAEADEPTSTDTAAGLPVPLIASASCW